MKIVRLNSKDGIGEDKLYNALLRIEKQWQPSMADNTEALKEYTGKIYKNSFVFGIVEDNEIVGVAAVYANDFINKQAYLTYIALNEKYINKGIGGKLLHICENEAKSQKMLTISLEVNKNNDRAIHFYKKNKYVFDRANDKTFYMTKEIV